MRAATLRLLLPLAGAMALVACSAGSVREPDELDEVRFEGSGVATTVVEPAWISAEMAPENLDSPAAWIDAAGKAWLFVTAKEGDRLARFDGDSGRFEGFVGAPGTGVKQFRRPNGIAVIDDLVFVVERDNTRVQVLGLPALDSLGTFGGGDLAKPYGIWVHRADGGYEAVVSDAYMDPADDDRVPQLADLDHRYRRYRVAVSGGTLQIESLGAFGDTTEAGAIRVPESLAGDVANGNLLLAEEDQPTGTRLRLYDTQFRYTGRDIGADLFKAQAEGIALWSCADGSGYWIATDQFADRSVFHLFDRRSFAHLGAFSSPGVANTDGVWLRQQGSPAFPHGVFYAVHDDMAVAAFAWHDIAAGLGVRASCTAEAVARP